LRQLIRLVSWLIGLASNKKHQNTVSELLSFQLISRQTQRSELAARISYFSCCRPTTHPSHALVALWWALRCERSWLSSLWWRACDAWRECGFWFWEGRDLRSAREVTLAQSLTCGATFQVQQVRSRTEAERKSMWVSGTATKHMVNWLTMQSAFVPLNGLALLAFVTHNFDGRRHGSLSSMGSKTLFLVSPKISFFTFHFPSGHNKSKRACWLSGYLWANVAKSPGGFAFYNFDLDLKVFRWFFTFFSGGSSAE
jgi:hypothetical protein